MIRALAFFAALACACAGALAQGIAAERERAWAEVIAARKALDEAKHKREEGIEPLPGERLGTVGPSGKKGFTRLGDAYFERQEALEKEVRAAEERLERAYRRWNELR